MKSRRIQRFIQGPLAVALVGVSVLICAPANAAHEAIYAVDLDNNLTMFWSDAPQTITSQYAISGIQQAEEIRGMDEWNGTLYALGSFGNLYTLDTFGNATQVGPQFSTPLSGAVFGVDNDPSGFRTVGNLGQSLLIDRTLGTVTSVLPNVPQRVDAVAYDGVSGTWYAANTLTDTLQTWIPGSGTVINVGLGLGIDASRNNGFDISALSGIAYMVTPAASSDPQANLYTVDLLTGMVSLVGQVGNPGEDWLFRAMTVVPEPSSFALLMLGAVGLFFARRQR